MQEGRPNRNDDIIKYKLFIKRILLKCIRMIIALIILLIIFFVTALSVENERSGKKERRLDAGIFIQHAYSDVFLLMKFKQKLSDLKFNVYLVPL